jgi:hypothetical protein
MGRGRRPAVSCWRDLPIVDAEDVATSRDAAEAKNDREPTAIKHDARLAFPFEQRK